MKAASRRRHGQEMKHDRIERIIMLCANDQECPIHDLISEISSELEVSFAASLDVFLNKKNFVLEQNALRIEESDRFWEDLKHIEKKEFFLRLERTKKLKRDAPPFFYISYRVES